MTREEYTEWFHMELIGQLVESDRFQQFIKVNYDVKQVIDDDTQEARLQVIEVPYEMAQDRIKAQVAEKLEKKASEIQVVGADALDKLKNT